jgi:hypothetical protein
MQIRGSDYRSKLDSTTARALSKHGWLIGEFGWHVLTIGKGVWIVLSSDFHALPDGQGRATHDGNPSQNF